MPPLTATAIRNAKPRQKPYKLADGRGLYLEVAPSGSRWWRFKFRHGGKERRLSLGTYPDVELSEARERLAEQRRLLVNGVDPSEHRRQRKRMAVERTGNSFELIAREWVAKQSGDWASAHTERIVSRLERDVFPYLGCRPIADIDAPELLSVLRRIEGRAVEAAHRARSTCGQVLRYAIATGRAERDVSADLRGVLKPYKEANFPAITDPKRLGELLRAVDSYQGTPIVEAAMKLAPLVFTRPGELRCAKWADVDLPGAQWRFTLSKTERAHTVPLAHQAVQILTELQPLTDRGPYVFPSARGRDRPMSDNAVLVALRSLGISQEEMTGHGWRATARMLLDEALHFRVDLIEHQLGHVVRDPLGRAYNRTTHLDERRAMMQRWADYLDELRAQKQ